MRDEVGEGGVTARFARYDEERSMKKRTSKEFRDDLRPKYDLAALKGGVRGKYAKRFKAGTNLVMPSLFERTLAESTPGLRGGGIVAREVEEVGELIFRALREMDAQCPGGLCDYVVCSPFAGKKRRDEAAITWGITAAVSGTWPVSTQECPYPRGRISCDRVIELSDGPLWLEVKLAWRTWFSSTARIVKHNDPFIYETYLGGGHRSHSVAGDFKKLEAGLDLEDARYSAVLLVGFDGKDAKMAADVATLVEREGLVQRGWHIVGMEWPTKQSGECWNRCWYAWRETR